MKTASFALFLLAGAAAFSGVARADETVTAVNQESARVIQHSAPTIWGAPVPESRSLSVEHEPARTASAAHPDHFFFGLGDRGVGNN